MEKSASPKKGDKNGDNRPSSKLSLQKRSRNTKTDKDKVKRTQSVVTASLVDLNETSEFKDGKSMSWSHGGSGDMAGSYKLEATEPSNKKLAQENINCQVCHKNLSHMNTQRQQQHVNRCIDKLEEKEKQEKAEKQALETAKTVVLDCPMCGHALNTEQARTSHLKKCSQQLGVATETMLQLIKKQEEERQTMISAGVIPPSVKSRIKSTDSNKPAKKRKAKEPKSKFDEDVQIAMAISSSLAEQENQAETGLIGHLSLPESTDRDKKKSKKKKNVEETCQLIDLTDADRQRRIADRVNSILFGEDQNQTVCTEKPLFKTKLAYHRESGALWGRAVRQGSEDDRGQFYVDALMPPIQISEAETGRNFKKLSSIPGREKSFTGGKLDESKMTEATEEVFTASTQTAVVLAELAVDNHSDDPLSQKSQDLNATGFLIEEEILTLDVDEKQKEKESLCSCLKSLVNNPSHSDIQLITPDGQKLYAHKNILAARSFQLIKDDRCNEVNIPLSSKSAFAFLNYIYTGELNLTASSQSELISFLERHGLNEVKVLCQKLKPRKDNRDNDTHNDDNKEELNDTKLDVMLKEIWGESDSDPEENEDDDQKIDELDEQDYQDILSSQRQKLRQTEEDNQQKVASSSGSADMDTVEDSECPRTSDISDETINDLVDDEDENCDKFNVNNGGNSEEVSVINYDNDSDDVVILDVGHGNKSASFVNKGAKNILNLKRTRKLNVTHELSRTSIEKNTDDVHIHYTDDLNTDTKSPCPKRLRFSCNNKSELNEIISPEEGLRIIGKDEVSSSSIKRLSSELSSKKEDEKFEIEYCGLSFDVSFTKDSSRSGSESSVTNTSRLDLSTTDLFGSPSPRKKPLFKSFERGTEAQNDYKTVLDYSENDLKEIIHKNHSNKHSDHSGSEVEKIDLSQSSNEISDNDVEITGDNLMEISQNSPTFGDHTCRNSTVTEEDDKLADKIFQAANKKPVMDSHSVLTANAGKRTVVSGDVLTPEINDLESYDFNDSFNDSLVTEAHLLIKDGSHSENFTLENSYSATCDKTKIERSAIEERRIDGDTRKSKDSRSMSFDEVVKIDTDCSDSGPDETHSVGKTVSHSKGCLSKSVEVKEELPSTVVEDESSGETEQDDLEENARDAQETFREEDITDAQETFKDGESVWEDFEDCGFTGMISSQDGLVINKSGDVSDGPDDEEQLKFDHSSPDVNDKQKKKVQQSASVIKKTSFKTPTMREAGDKKKGTWAVPSPFTPMPNYDTMNTPMLKKQVQRFGVKPVGKKRMVKVLKDIYQQTHQYETDSEFEDGPDNSDFAMATVVKAASDCVTKKTVVTAEIDNFPASQTDISSSQESDVSELLEETCIHPPSDDSDVSSSPQKGVDLTKKLTDYIQGNPQLKIRMLMYEPIELDVFKKDLKEAGIKCSMDKVMEFLDERCIAFTTKNTRKRSTSNRGRKKKSKPETKS